jgi:hypothetical protein
MQITFFCESLHDLYRERCKQVVEYVKRLPESHFDQIDRSQFSELTVAKYALPDMPAFATGDIQRDEPVFIQGSDVVRTTVYFPHQGDPSHFRYYDRSHPRPSLVLEHKDGMFLKTYSLGKRELQRLDDLVDQDVKLVQQYVRQTQDMVPRFNTSMLQVAAEAFDHRVHEINENRGASATIAKSKFTVRKRDDGAEKVIVPVQRKLVPVEAPTRAEPLQEYTLGMHEYNDILSTVSSMAMVMERTPSVFEQMNEEPLRTILLVALNGVYEGQACGETFNGHGKTDILIRRGDRNVFIAECLMWRGPAYLNGKMSDQLFQYAMWRDSKLALIVFNRGGNFTQVVGKMKETVRGHPQLVKDLAWTHESGARYLFRRHDDPNRHFVLTAVAFDVPVSS